PPGSPTSPTGRPIPPPPGLGGRGAAPGARPSGAGPARPGGGAGAPRPGGAGRPAGAGRPPGGFMPGRPGGGPGGFPGRPGGGPGGPGGRGRPGGPRPRPARRRRRRTLEEIEPTQATSYTHSDAPVPEGEIVIERGSTAQDVGPRLNRTSADVVLFLLQHGDMVTPTQSLSDDMIELFAADVGAEIRLVDPGDDHAVDLQALLADEVDN